MQVQASGIGLGFMVDPSAAPGGGGGTMSGDGSWWQNLLGQGLNIGGRILVGRYGTPEGTVRQTGPGGTFEYRQLPGQTLPVGGVVGSVGFPSGPVGAGISTGTVLLLGGGILAVALLMMNRSR